MQQCQPDPSDNLNLAIIRANERKELWSLDRASEIAEELSTVFSMLWSYDDGPPENWIDLVGTRSGKIGLISIISPFALICSSKSKEGVQDFLCERKLEVVLFESWKEERFSISPSSLNQMFGVNSYDEFDCQGGGRISADDLWFMTVTR